jgi:ABC-type branched-subunit amino acid transport system ATPase component
MEVSVEEPFGPESPIISGEAPPSHTDPSVTIGSLTFSDGQTIELGRSDIVVLVGPNNAGKSQALRDIVQKVASAGSIGVVVNDLTVNQTGSTEDVIHWLEQYAFSQGQSAPDQTVFYRMGVGLHISAARAYWPNTGGGLRDIAPMFVHSLTTEERLTAANPAPNIALLTQPRTHPIHYMQADDTIETRISGHFRKAFGQDLIVHRNAGNEVPLYCGERPEMLEGEDRVSLSYLRRLEELPRLQMQGDGMRAFVGVLLNALTVRHSVLLVDEPEAFLHPPQARMLGHMLVDETPDDRQIFLSTHSGDFLRGVLESGSARVRVLRIDREGNTNKVRALDSEGIQQFWGDPILRYSNVLDGVFHNRVVLCEGDADCRFYQAVLDAIPTAEDEDVREDLMFTHCGGKSRMPVVIRSLMNLGVPVTVIADFDLLNDEHPLRPIVAAVGGDWAALEQGWRAVKSAIEDKKPELSSEEVTNEITQVLAGIDDRIFPSNAGRAIRKILARSSPWATAKQAGRAFVPNGEATARFDALMEQLHGLGVFVVEVGEIEQFVKSVGNHGPSWVNTALERNLQTDEELETARAFVRDALL